MHALTLLMKPCSGNCNMRCKYCFYADVSDNRQVKSFGMMSVELLEVLVKKALFEAEKVCHFGFQGGEPMLIGLDFFRALISLERKHNVRNVQISHSIQTNGTLIDEEWAAFFAENDFLVGLSIDGDKQTHNFFRVDAQGADTFQRTMKAVDILKKTGAAFNILTVITKQLAAHPQKVYRFYKQNDFRYIQFIPCLDSFTASKKELWHLDADSYCNFLCQIFDLWYEDFTKNEYYSIRIFENYIQILAGYNPENCGMAGRCTPYALVEADGSVYPCDFYAIDQYKLGNIKTHSFEELIRGEAAAQFMAESLEINSECKACKYFSLCRGGCRRDREQRVATEAPINRYCKTFKRFFDYALARMLHIASAYKTN